LKITTAIDDDDGQHNTQRDPFESFHIVSFDDRL